MTKRKILNFIVVGAISVGLGLWAANQTIKKQQPRGYPGLGGDFTLESATGPVSLKDFQGKTVALYFGFTTCPDICPTTLGMLGAAFKQLSENELEQTQGIFITVDPERDTTDKLAAYASHFHPDFIGLTGSLETITDIAKRYGVLFMKVDAPDSEMGYTMDHSSVVFIINDQGVVESLVRHGDDSNVMLEKIRETLNN